MRRATLALLGLGAALSGMAAQAWRPHTFLHGAGAVHWESATALLHGDASAATVGLALWLGPWVALLGPTGALVAQVVAVTVGCWCAWRAARHVVDAELAAWATVPILGSGLLQVYGVSRAAWVFALLGVALVALLARHALLSSAVCVAATAVASWAWPWLVVPAAAALWWELERWRAGNHRALVPPAGELASAAGAPALLALVGGVALQLGGVGVGAPELAWPASPLWAFAPLALAVACGLWAVPSAGPVGLVPGLAVLGVATGSPTVLESWLPCLLVVPLGLAVGAERALAARRGRVGSGGGAPGLGALRPGTLSGGALASGTPSTGLSGLGPSDATRSGRGNAPLRGLPTARAVAIVATAVVGAAALTWGVALSVGAPSGRHTLAGHAPHATLTQPLSVAAADPARPAPAARGRRCASWQPASGTWPCAGETPTEAWGLDFTGRCRFVVDDEGPMTAAAGLPGAFVRVPGVPGALTLPHLGQLRGLAVYVGVPVSAEGGTSDLALQVNGAPVPLPRALTPGHVHRVALDDLVVDQADNTLTIERSRSGGTRCVGAWLTR